MLKKSLIVLIAVLILEIVLGMTLLNNYNADLKTVHGITGALVGLTAAVTVYAAFREKAARATIGLVVAAFAFVILAAVGGKMTATDYDQGLMLMRTSAIVALALSLVSFYKLRK